MAQKTEKMNIHLIQVGKTKKEIEPLEAEFLKRLKSFCKLQITVIPTSDKEKESLEIENRAVRDSYLIILDEGGKELPSKEFANLVKRERDFGMGSITFVIGGPSGTTPNLRRKADFLLSFSKMTIAHQLFRIVFLEQLYRIFTIISGHPYHK